MLKMTHILINISVDNLDSYDMISTRYL